MRLFELQELLMAARYVVENLDVSTASGAYLVKGARNLREALYPLERTGLFEAEFRNLRETGLFMTLADEVSVGDTAYGQLTKKLSELGSAIQLLMSTLDTVGVTVRDSDENSVALKLPPVKTFEDLGALANDLKKIITIPISEPEIGGEVTITAVDNGSIWLYVLVGTPIAVTMIAGIAAAAAVVYKKFQEGEAFRQYVRNLKIQNDQSELFLEAQKAHIAATVVEEARQLEQNMFASHDPERMKRLEHSIGTTAELIKDGFEINPSILAPEDVKGLFPDFKALRIPGFVSKQIEKGGDEPGG
jgi:hypothetical protein